MGMSEDAYKRRKDLSDLSASWKIGLPKQQYLTVYIWNNFEGMFRNNHFENRDYAGCFIGVPYRIDAEGRRHGRKFGEIHLVQNHFGGGVAAHEIQHFLIAYILDWALDLDQDDEEICHLAEEVTEKFWKAFYKRYKEV